MNSMFILAIKVNSPIPMISFQKDKRWQENKEGLAQHTDSARVYGELFCQEGSTDHYAILVRKVLWYTKLTFKFH